MDTDNAYGRVGFEYRYGFWLDDAIMSNLYGYKSPPGNRTVVVFEMRTNFIVKQKMTDNNNNNNAINKGEEEEILDSERLGVCFLLVNDSDALPLLSFRLKDYWMARQEMDQLERDAVAFARRQMALAAPSDRVIPVVVRIDVCTVQREGEEIGATRARAITSKHLVPLHVYFEPPNDGHCTKRPPKLMGFLREIKRYRVVNNEGLVNYCCSICSKKPWFGVEVSRLRCCRQLYHSHCLVKWLEHNHLCRSCGFPAYDPDYIWL